MDGCYETRSQNLARCSCSCMRVRELRVCSERSGRAALLIGAAPSPRCAPETPEVSVLLGKGSRCSSARELKWGQWGWGPCQEQLGAEPVSVRQPLPAACSCSFSAIPKRVCLLLACVCFLGALSWRGHGWCWEPGEPRAPPALSCCLCFPR